MVWTSGRLRAMKRFLFPLRVGDLVRCESLGPGGGGEGVVYALREMAVGEVSRVVLKKTCRLNGSCPGRIVTLSV